MNFLILTFLFATGSRPRVSVSRQVAVDPAAVARAHDQIAAQLTPSAKLKLENVASSLMSQTNPGDFALAQIRAAFPGFNLGNNDLEALRFVAVSEAIKSADSTLKAIDSEVVKMTGQKNAIRTRLEAAGEKVPDNAASHLSKVQVMMPGDGYARAPASLPDGATVQELKQRLDQLNSMISMNQGLVQTMTRNIEQANGVLSSSLSKVQSIQSSTIPNLK